METDNPSSQNPSPEASSENQAPLDLRSKIIEVIKTVYDPEIPVNIYELGLIYDILIDPHQNVYVRMTLTSPNCPEAVTLPPQVEAKILAVPGVNSAKVEVVFDPPWTPEKMTDAAKLILNMM